jgi:hypothetical protein
MNTNVYNVDSKFRNSTSYPNSANFVFNKVDQVIDNTPTVEPFNEKNVIEMRITSLELPNTIYFINSSRGNNTLLLGATTVTIASGSYTKQELVTLLDNMTTDLPNISFTYSSTTGKVTINNTSGSTLSFPSSNTNYLSLGQILGFLSTTTIPTATISIGTNAMIDPQQTYFFLRINDFGNIINQNRRYVAKILSDSQSRYNAINQETFIKIVTNNIKFDQPIDIPRLQISLEDEYGNLIDLNGSNYSFTLETVVITNTILKNYNEIKFYNDEVMERILRAKMLAYYEKQVEPIVNNTLTSTYSQNISNLNNMQEYTAFGSRNNYAPSFSYYVDTDKK